MAKVIKTEDEINEFAKIHGCRVDLVREALNQPDLIEQFMSPPYNISEEGAIASVVLRIMEKQGLLDE